MNAGRATFILILALCSFVAPVDAQAQRTARAYRVGYLTPWAQPFEKEGIQIFEQTLRDRGYIQGENISIIYRSAEDQDALLPALAAQLLQLNVDVFVTAGTPATRAAQQATSTIPIVMLTVLDPVHAGFVATLSRPGGNITGSSELSEELIPKRLELIREAIPKASLIAVLWDPAHPTNALDLKRAEAAARALGMKIEAVPAHEVAEIDRAFAEMRRWRPDALLILTSPIFGSQMPQIAELARNSRLPTVYGGRPGALAGVLMSYGPDFSDQYRHAAVFVDKILKGAKPAELPVEQPTRFELLVNSRTAKALGLTIPKSILVRTDEVVNCYLKRPTYFGHCPKSKEDRSEP